MILFILLETKMKLKLNHHHLNLNLLKHGGVKVHDDKMMMIDHHEEELLQIETLGMKKLLLHEKMHGKNILFIKKQLCLPKKMFAMELHKCNTFKNLIPFTKEI